MDCQEETMEISELQPSFENNLPASLKSATELPELSKESMPQELRKESYLKKLSRDLLKEKELSLLRDLSREKEQSLSIKKDPLKDHTLLALSKTESLIPKSKIEALESKLQLKEELSKPGLKIEAEVKFLLKTESTIELTLSLLLKVHLSEVLLAPLLSQEVNTE